jgi:hypothetical protein
MPTIDLNAMVTSMILTGLGGFSTPAGHIGSRFEVGHDISLLIPEVWCRMGPSERDPQNLIADGMLQKIEDFEADGRTIPASRLGYRITRRFVRTFLARVFDNPSKVFTDEILNPELQDPESFADGLLHIAEAQQRVAQRYFEDGGYELACPPLQAVLSVMARGDYEGKQITDPEVRQMFTRDALLSSDWYRRRLAAKKDKDIEHWQSFQQRLEGFIERKSATAQTLGLADRLQYVQQQLSIAQSPDYEQQLVGTLGVDPLQPSMTDATLVNRLASV